MIRKLVISNGRSERELLLVGHIVIGRDPACHVSEPDPLLSRRHAEVIAGPQGGGVIVRDLNSRNGMLVNGEKAHERVLLPGDVVQLGGLQLRYVEEQPRAAEAFVSRVPERRVEPDIDRFRPDPAAQPGRWRPEPTPLPGRRSTAPAALPVPPPVSQPIVQPPAQARVRNFTPVPRGRAAFQQDQPGAQPDDQTILLPAPIGSAMGTRPADADTTVLAPMPRRERAAPIPFPDPDATILAAAPSAPAGTTIDPGDNTFQQAIAHLAGLAAPEDRTAPDAGERLTANAELRITAATPGCAELLGMAGESLVGDSLADAFLRAVRCAYAHPQSTISLSIARGAQGSVVVSLSVDRTGGTE